VKFSVSASCQVAGQNSGLLLYPAWCIPAEVRESSDGEEAMLCFECHISFARLKTSQTPWLDKDVKLLGILSFSPFGSQRGFTRKSLVIGEMVVKQIDF